LRYDSLEDRFEWIEAETDEYQISERRGTAVRESIDENQEEEDVYDWIPESFAELLPVPFTLEPICTSPAGDNSGLRYPLLLRSQ
jgi:hypothetical protein